VRDCGGFVDKFIGDAMLVVFGLFDAADDRRDDCGAGAALPREPGPPGGGGGASEK
jgi:class 3 adenylate cyclase